MAARKRRIRQSEDTRAKIQATQIIHRLTKHVMGELDLSATQVRAAQVLLAKTLPDLKGLEHSSPDGEALNFRLFVPQKEQ